MRPGRERQALIAGSRCGFATRKVGRGGSSPSDHWEVHHDHELGPELVRLLDDDRLNDLLARVSLTDVADAWRCYYERSISGEQVDYSDPDWWAVQFWLSPAPVFDREELGREGLLALVTSVGDDLLHYVGAGPLEDFIDAIEDRIRWFEESAARLPEFRKALAYVHVGYEPEWVWDRLERAAGVPLVRPPN